VLRPTPQRMSLMTPHPASLPVDRLLEQCSTERTRRSGPGGQHRNKVETAVVITHQPSGVRAEASERRSQAENLTQAVFRLRVKLALKVRVDRPHGTSELWQSRTVGSRLGISPEHDDFPAILAEALDVLASLEWDLPKAAQVLGVSASQLVRLLKLEGDALGLLNAERGKVGLHRLT